MNWFSVLFALGGVWFVFSAGSGFALAVQQGLKRWPSAVRLLFGALFIGLALYLGIQR
jgi:hypothetical protein